MLSEVFCGWRQLSCLSTCSLPPPFKLFRFPAWALLLSFPFACARSNIRCVLVDTCANWCVDSMHMLYATFAYCPAEVELVCRRKCVGLTSFDPSTVARFKLHDVYFPYFIKVLLHPHAVSRRIICQDMNWLSWLGIKAQWLEMEISRAVGTILFIKGPSDDLRPSKTGRGETGKDSNHHDRKLMTSVAETERE